MINKKSAPPLRTPLGVTPLRLTSAPLCLCEKQHFAERRNGYQEELNFHQE
jgi:hypothetical protein